MNLHNDTKLFDQAIRATAQQMQLKEIYIEKDYWVTYALHTIFNHEIGKQTVFQGGTALTKCYGLIDRFSEDIDLVVTRTEKETANQLKNKIKTITNVVEAIMPEVEIEGVTQKMGMNRKTGHSYPKSFKGDFGQVRDVIILESTWLGYFEPFTTSKIKSFIYDMMLETGQEKMIKDYCLQAFTVQVLDTKRTICEKIMSLVRFSYSENPIEDLRAKVRHTYDLHQLLKNDKFSTFFNSEDFDVMLLRVAHDDVYSFRNNNDWLTNHPNQSLFFAELEKTWEQIKKEYSDTFKQLVYGDFPNEDMILESFKLIKKRLENIKWSVEINN